VKFEISLFSYQTSELNGTNYEVPLTKNYFEIPMNCQGHVVAQLVKALRYKPEGYGFDSRWFHWNLYCPGVDSASNINEYQESFLGGKGSLCVGLATLPLSCADCLEI
jgi:hypothetical protein